MYSISERNIRSSDSFNFISDAYEQCLQIKSDLMHSRIATGLSHGLSIGFSPHQSYHSDRGARSYIAPTLLGTGNNSRGQLGKQVDGLKKPAVSIVDSFEKIFLTYCNEEYYPLQVCCGFNISLILAIDARGIQSLESINRKDNQTKDKAQFILKYGDQIARILHRSKVFFAGEIKIHKEEDQTPLVGRQEGRKLTFKNDQSNLQFQEQSPNVKRANRILLNGKKNVLTIESAQMEQENPLLNSPHIPHLGQLDDDDDDDEEQIQSQASEEEDEEAELLKKRIRIDIVSQEQVKNYLRLNVYIDIQKMTIWQKKYRLQISECIQFPQMRTFFNEGFVTQISCGMNFCLALMSNLRVFSWGDNQFGNLGTGDFNFRPTPELIQFSENKGKDSKITFISCGSYHAAAVAQTGKLYTWGSSLHCQLGQKVVLNQTVPSLVAGDLKEKNILMVACGGYHTICITNEGYAYSWGMNRNGQLGQGDSEMRSVPTKINRLQNYFIIKVACGVNNSFLFTQVGKIFACGSNSNNKMGLEVNAQREQCLNPTAVETGFLKGVDKSRLKDTYIYQIAASAHYTYALSNRGLITTWGLQVKGSLGRKITNFVQEKVNCAEKAFSCMGIPHTVSFKFDLSQEGAMQKFFFPIQNTLIFKARGKDFLSSDIVDIKLGTFHTMALTNAGEVYIWGSNQMGQHGCTNAQIRDQYEDEGKKRISIIVPDISPETLPSVVSFFNIEENRRITFIAAGSEYCMAIENKRLVYAWGRNSEGQLGIGKTQLFVDTPTMVFGLEGNLMKEISCGDNHTLFLTDTGRVYSCGSPKDGKLGLGQRTNTQIQPQLIEGLEKVEHIACGANHSMALAKEALFSHQDQDQDIDESNTGNTVASTKMVIYTWGSGWESKLGHGDRENMAEPTEIQTNFQFKSISAGSHHSAAITLDDMLVVWGPFRYFGHTRPDENTKNKKAATVHQTDYQEFTKPTLHPKILDKIRFVCLGDKTTVLVTKKDNKVIQFGIFEQDLRELRKTNSYEFVLDKLVPLKQEESEIPVNEINKISVSKDHIAVLGKNQVYTWGFDNLTGRLGLGYIFLDR